VDANRHTAAVVGNAHVSRQAKSATSISVACPPIASSLELSKISQIRWWSPSGPVVPIYIPGRFRTGSRPSRTVIEAASYVIGGPSYIDAFF